MSRCGDFVVLSGLFRRLRVMLVRVQEVEDVRVGGGEVIHKEGRVECCHLKEKS